MASSYHLYSERELLERLAYMGPVQSFGGGVTKGYDWSEAVTEQTVWQPYSGNRFVISCLMINTSGACTVSVFDEVDDETNRLFKGVLAANATVIIPYPVPRVAADANRKLEITTSATGGYLTVWGWESGVGTTTTSVSTSSSSSSSSMTSISSSSSSISISSSSSSSSSFSSSSSSSSSQSTSSISQTTTG